MKFCVGISDSKDRHRLLSRCNASPKVVNGDAGKHVCRCHSDIDTFRLRNVRYKSFLHSIEPGTKISDA